MPDQVTTMFAAMTPPWHGKGIVLDHYPDSKEAYKASGLDWKVATGPARDHLSREIPGRVVIYRVKEGPDGEREDPILGLATTLYSPIQNKAMFEMGDAFFKDGRA